MLRRSWLTLFQCCHHSIQERIAEIPRTINPKSKLLFPFLLIILKKNKKCYLDLLITLKDHSQKVGIFFHAFLSVSSLPLLILTPASLFFFVVAVIREADRKDTDSVSGSESTDVTSTTSTQSLRRKWRTILEHSSKQQQNSNNGVFKLKWVCFDLASSHFLCQHASFFLLGFASSR